MKNAAGLRPRQRRRLQAMLGRELSYIRYVRLSDMPGMSDGNRYTFYFFISITFPWHTSIFTRYVLWRQDEGIIVIPQFYRPWLVPAVLL